LTKAAMKGLDGLAGELDAVSITIQTGAGRLPEAADLMGIFPYLFELTVNGGLALRFRLDQARMVWGDQALILVYELGEFPPEDHRHKNPPAIAIEATDEVTAQIVKPRDAEPLTVSARDGFNIRTGLHSKLIAEENPVLKSLLQHLGIEFGER
jgi:hypothetical protein